jgi:hypothetical protein
MPALEEGGSAGPPEIRGAEHGGSMVHPRRTSKTMELTLIAGRDGRRRE